MVRQSPSGKPISNPDANTVVTGPEPTNPAETGSPSGHDRKAVVRYTGSSDVRTITATDLERVLSAKEGRELKAVTWEKANNWTVLKADLDFLDDDEFARIITADKDLTVEETSEPSQPKE